MTPGTTISRRRLLALLGAATVTATAGCGGNGAEPGSGPGFDLVRADVARATAGDAAVTAAAVASVSRFTADLYGRLVAPAGSANLVCSPYSAFVALAMAAQGARGATARELLAALHSSAAGLLADGANGLDRSLAKRAGTTRDLDGNEVVVELASVNGLWGQKGLAWQQPFLDALAKDFGTGMRQVDYRAAAEPARQAINAWVSGQTHQRIPELIGQGLVDTLTRLVLVNAVYFKAPWASPFTPQLTKKSPFTRLDGSTVTADLMQDGIHAGFGKGAGWAAVDLPYARGELAMAVVLPDRGRFAEVEKALDGAWLAKLLTGLATEPGPGLVQVGLPRWTTRTQADPGAALQALGIRTAFTDAADLSGITTAEPLHVSAVVHEGFIAVDEKGTEAAAATAVMAGASGAALDPPTLIADRPFLYVIHDLPTGTPLFVGRVLDPTG
jgi:serine protease inhibitor